MISRIEINGVHMAVDENLQKYITKKIGRLDRYVPRSSRESVHVEVKVKETKTHAKQSCECEVVLHVPEETITAKEATINMFAAVDIVEDKLKQQLRSYKDQRSNHRTQIKKALVKLRSRSEEM